MSERPLDPSSPLNDYEKYLLEKFFSDPNQLPQKFKAWVADYVANNGNFHVESLPSLKGEEWRYVGATGQPAFGTNVANFDGGTPPTARSVRFMKNVLGDVKLQGLIGFTGGGVAANTTLFTLPEGYRPYTDGTSGGAGTSHYLAFPIAFWNANFVVGTTNSVIQIGTNGTVYSPASWSAGQGIWIDGITFRAA